MFSFFSNTVEAQSISLALEKAGRHEKKLKKVIRYFAKKR